MDIRSLIHKQKIKYLKIKSVYCPTLIANVYFSNLGFKHLLFKSNGKARNINERYLKLKCLNFAPGVIKFASKIEGIRRLDIKIKGKTKNCMLLELRHTAKKGYEIGVIVRRVGDGKYQFFSVKRY